MGQWLSVMGGGALGALGRYLMAGAITRLAGPGFPLGTLIVNILGGFAIGALVEVMALRWSVAPETRLFLITGILGGFTTFSAFTLELGGMIERGDIATAGLYALASVLGSLGAFFAALALFRSVL